MIDHELDPKKDNKFLRAPGRDTGTCPFPVISGKGVVMFP